VGWCRGRGTAWEEKKQAEPKKNNFFLFIQKSFERVEWIRSKGILPDLDKFLIKYRLEAFETRNNFHHWNFSKFRIGFELKIKEVLEFEI
jgi:hypothetical protein